MAISSRSRRGTSPAFWRSHNAAQTLLVQACMPSIQKVSREALSLMSPRAVALATDNSEPRRFIVVQV